jgi:hypothetical protein
VDLAVCISLSHEYRILRFGTGIVDDKFEIESACRTRLGKFFWASLRAASCIFPKKAMYPVSGMGALFLPQPPERRDKGPAKAMPLLPR